MPIREAQKHMDPTDPDPQHCYSVSSNESQKFDHMFVVQPPCWRRRGWLWVRLTRWRSMRPSPHRPSPARRNGDSQRNELTRVSSARSFIGEVSYRRKSDECPKFDMVFFWQSSLAYPSGEEGGYFTCSKDFYLPSLLRVGEGGKGVGTLCRELRYPPPPLNRCSRSSLLWGSEREVFFPLMPFLNLNAYLERGGHIQTQMLRK